MKTTSKAKPSPINRRPTVTAHRCKQQLINLMHANAATQARNSAVTTHPAIEGDLLPLAADRLRQRVDRWPPYAGDRDESDDRPGFLCCPARSAPVTWRPGFFTQVAKPRAGDADQVSLQRVSQAAVHSWLSGSAIEGATRTAASFR